MRRRAFLAAMAAAPFVRLTEEHLAPVAMPVVVSATLTTWQTKTPEEMLADIEAIICRMHDQQTRAVLAQYEVIEVTSLEQAERLFCVNDRGECEKAAAFFGVTGIEWS